MTARRIIGSLLTTTLVATGAGIVATTAPAAAVDTVQTRIVPGTDTRPVISSYSTPLEYGDDISASVNVEAYINGVWTQIYNGPVAVTEQVVGSAAATTVASSASAYVFDSFPARGKAIYTVTYGGGTGGYPAVNYAPTSASYSIANVQRKMSTSTISGNRAGFKGKLAPATKAKIKILKKHGKKFKKFKVLRSSKSGRFAVILPAPRRGKFHWKIIFAGDSRFAPSTIQGATYKR